MRENAKKFTQNEEKEAKKIQKAFYEVRKRKKKCVWEKSGVMDPSACLMDDPFYWYSKTLWNEKMKKNYTKKEFQLKKSKNLCRQMLLVEHKFPGGDNERHRKTNQSTVAFDKHKKWQTGPSLKPSNESIQEI